MKKAIFLLFVAAVVLGSCRMHDPLTGDKGVKINGVKWATRNVDKPGTFAATPQDAGKFYQWNDKTAWTDSTAAWSSAVTVGDVWTDENDPCPAGWRVPKLSEWASLIESGSTWTNGGRTFSEKLFLPAAGFLDNENGNPNATGSIGNYWIAMPYNVTSAYFVKLNADNAAINYYYRSGGRCVRCVKK